MSAFRENQVVELLEDVIEDGVAMARGAYGTIVEVYSKPREAYEVEFVDQNDDVLAQLTLSSSQIRPYSVEKKAPF